MPKIEDRLPVNYGQRILGLSRLYAHRPSENVEIRRRRYQQPLDRELLQRDAYEREMRQLQMTPDVDAQVRAGNMGQWLHQTGDYSPQELETLNRQRLLEDLAEMQRPRPQGYENFRQAVAPQPGIVQGLPGFESYGVAPMARPFIRKGGY